MTPVLRVQLANAADKHLMALRHALRTHVANRVSPTMTAVRTLVDSVTCKTAYVEMAAALMTRSAVRPDKFVMT